MTATRIATGAAGLVLLGWGIRLLLDLDQADLIDAGIWLAGGVVVHDFLLAPAVVGIGYLLGRRVSPESLVPVTAGLVVLGAVTAAVLPTVGRFGAKPDDPFLLNRPYLLWWSVLAGCGSLAVVGAAWWRRRALGRPAEPDAPAPRRT